MGERVDQPPGANDNVGATSPLATLALIVGGICWCFAADPMPGRVRDGGWHETVVALSAVCGMIGAVGVGQGLYAIRRRHRPRWAAWAALAVNGGLVVLALVRIGRWL